ncbi:MAG: hypothetical protein WA432_01960 [Candidatus Babeliaceae bacterium]
MKKLLYLFTLNILVTTYSPLHAGFLRAPSESLSYLVAAGLVGGVCVSAPFIAQKTRQMVGSVSEFNRMRSEVDTWYRYLQHDSTHDDYIRLMQASVRDRDDSEQLLSDFECLKNNIESILSKKKRLIDNFTNNKTFQIISHIYFLPKINTIERYDLCVEAYQGYLNSLDTKKMQFKPSSLKKLNESISQNPIRNDQPNPNYPEYSEYVASTPSYPSIKNVVTDLNQEGNYTPTSMPTQNSQNITSPLPIGHYPNLNPNS